WHRTSGYSAVTSLSIVSPSSNPYTIFRSIPIPAARYLVRKRYATLRNPSRVTKDSGGGVDIVCNGPMRRSGHQSAGLPATPHLLCVQNLANQIAGIHPRVQFRHQLHGIDSVTGHF